MDNLVWPVFVAIATVAGTSITVANALNSRFAKQEINDVRLNGTIDSLLLQINGNRESIAHARERFFDEIKQRDDRIKQLETRLSSVEKYLAKGDFTIRHL